jgi:hypothetical protein
MTCRGLGWADPNLRRGRVVVTLAIPAMKRLAVCGLRLGRGPQ